MPSYPSHLPNNTKEFGSYAEASDYLLKDVPTQPQEVNTHHRRYYAPFLYVEGEEVTLDTNPYEEGTQDHETFRCIYGDEVKHAELLHYINGVADAIGLRHEIDYSWTYGGSQLRFYWQTKKAVRVVDGDAPAIAYAVFESPALNTAKMASFGVTQEHAKIVSALLSDGINWQLRVWTDTEKTCDDDCVACSGHVAKRLASFRTE